MKNNPIDRKQIKNQLVGSENTELDGEFALRCKAAARNKRRNADRLTTTTTAEQNAQGHKCLRTVWRQPLDRTPNIGSGGQKMESAVALFKGVHPRRLIEGEKEEEGRKEEGLTALGNF